MLLILVKLKERHIIFGVLPVTFTYHYCSSCNYFNFASELIFRNVFNNNTNDVCADIVSTKQIKKRESPSVFKIAMTFTNGKKIFIN